MNYHHMNCLKALALCADKKDTRPIAHLIHFYADHTAATNGHLMLILPSMLTEGVAPASWHVDAVTAYTKAKTNVDFFTFAGALGYQPQPHETPIETLLSVVPKTLSYASADFAPHYLLTFDKVAGLLRDSTRVAATIHPNGGRSALVTFGEVAGYGMLMPRRTDYENDLKKAVEFNPTLAAIEVLTDADTYAEVK